MEKIYLDFKMFCTRISWSIYTCVLMKLFFTDMRGVRFHGGFNKDNLEKHALNVAEMWSFSGLIYSNELACFFVVVF